MEIAECTDIENIMKTEEEAEDEKSKEEGWYISKNLIVIKWNMSLLADLSRRISVFLFLSHGLDPSGVVCRKAWEPNFYCIINREIHYYAGHEIKILEALDSFGAITWPAVRHHY